MKSTFGLWMAFGFVGLLLLIGLSVWTYTALQGNTATDSGSPAEKGVFGSLFPFGRSSTPEPGGGRNEQNETEFLGEVPRLRKISSEVAAGAGFALGVTGVPSLRYIERQTGHIYETPVDAPTSVRLTNTTIPAVHDAVWINASTTLMRFLADSGEIENFVGVIATTSVDQSLQGQFLKNYTRISSDAGFVLGVLETPSGALLEVVNADGTKPKSIFTSVLTSWVPHLVGNRVFVTSAPSGTAAGSLYEVTGGTLSRIVGGIVGLTVLPNQSAERVLLSSGTQNTLVLSVRTLKSGATLALSQGTLAQKCAWIMKTEKLLCAVPKSLPQALYPDDWLLGRVHTSDSLWLIDTDTGTMTSAMDLEAESGMGIDASQVVVSDDGSYAALINRNDGTLWLATLTQR